MSKYSVKVTHSHFAWMFFNLKILGAGGRGPSPLLNAEGNLC